MKLYLSNPVQLPSPSLPPTQVLYRVAIPSSHVTLHSETFHSLQVPSTEAFPPAALLTGAVGLLVVGFLFAGVGRLCCAGVGQAAITQTALVSFGPSQPVCPAAPPLHERRRTVTPLPHVTEHLPRIQVVHSALLFVLSGYRLLGDCLLGDRILGRAFGGFRSSSTVRVGLTKSIPYSPRDGHGLILQSICILSLPSQPRSPAAPPTHAR